MKISHYTVVPVFIDFLQEIYAGSDADHSTIIFPYVQLPGLRRYHLETATVLGL